MEDNRKQREEQLLRYFRLLDNLDISSFQGIFSTLPVFPPYPKQRLSFSPHWKTLVTLLDIKFITTQWPLTWSMFVRSFSFPTFIPITHLVQTFGKIFQSQDIEHWRDIFALCRGLTANITASDLVDLSMALMWSKSQMHRLRLTMAERLHWRASSSWFLLLYSWYGSKLELQLKRKSNQGEVNWGKI